MLSDVVTYIESLAKRHKSVLHSKSECHFADLNDKKNSLLPTQMRYPFVMFEATGFKFANNGVAPTKIRTCSLSVMTHVSDTGDYAQIETALALTEQIVTDIFTQMCVDKHNRDYRFLLNVDMSDSEVTPIENHDDALYGQIATFQFNDSVCIKDSINNFNS